MLEEFLLSIGYDDNQIDIHIPPEFLNVANFIDTDGTLSPDINIYVSGM